MSSQRGKRFETNLCSAVYDATDGELFPEPVGYSGNHRVPAPDIKVDDGHQIHAIKLKTSKKDRVSVVYDPEDTNRDDLHQLLTYAQKFPRQVVPYVGIKFTNRQLVCIPLWLGAPTAEAAVRSATKTAPIDVRYTYAGNLSVHRPSTEEWPSASAGDSAEYLLEAIDYR